MDNKNGNITFDDANLKIYSMKELTKEEQGLIKGGNSNHNLETEEDEFGIEISDDETEQLGG